MANSVYSINKGINKSVEFRGLKAQYIWYLGGGLIGLLISFAILYIAGVNTFLCLGIILISGTMLFIYVYRLSRTYGEYGMMKKLARTSIPDTVRAAGRDAFFRKSSSTANRKDNKMK